MASTKERERWERWFDEVAKRVDRQRVAITRLVMLLTEATAALHEIAAIDAGDTDRFDKAVRRAREALKRIEEPAAAATSDAEELVTEEVSAEDPRRKY